MHSAIGRNLPVYGDDDGYKTIWLDSFMMEKELDYDLSSVTKLRLVDSRKKVPRCTIRDVCAVFVGMIPH